jgi:endo-1,3-1,4-beta-glycanase ExoK
MNAETREPTPARRGLILALLLGQSTTTVNRRYRICAAIVSIAMAGVVAGPTVSLSQEAAAGKSFVDDFTTFNRSRWYVADGWTNGDHQNCIWSKDQLKIADGVLTLSFEKKKIKHLDYACAEIQTKKRFGYGVYEARLKTDTGSGLNAAFFTFVGPADKQPHDEIDFEVLTRDTTKVSVNTYVSQKPKNGAVVDVKGGTNTGFNDYAFVWEKDSLRWYLNGQLVHTAPNAAELPTHAQKIFFSLWGTETLNDWMGPFQDPGRKVTLEVDRVAFTALGEPCQFPESVACKLQ